MNTKTKTILIGGAIITTSFANTEVAPEFRTVS